MFNFCKISFKRGTDVILKTTKHKLVRGEKFFPFPGRGMAVCSTVVYYYILIH